MQENMTEETEEQRTLTQNKAMHKYFSNLAKDLNDAGYDMKKVLKPSIEIPWTPESVKAHLWKPIQNIMIDKESTTKLKTHQVDLIYKTLSRHLSEKFLINTTFPNRRD